MSNSAEFTKAAEDVKNLTQKPVDQELLDLYGLFKQATVGDCNTDKPGMLDFKGKAKWGAWDSNRGLSTADAESKYVTLANELIEKYK